jgi:DNA helicase MCM8
MKILNESFVSFDNFRLKGPILSRFDLVFILIDRADDELDYRLSEHVLAQHNRSIRSSHNNTTVNSTRTQHEVAGANHHHQQEDQTPSTSDEGIPLLDELRLKPGQSIEPVGPSLLQKVTIFIDEHEIGFISIVHCLCTSIC